MARPACEHSSKRWRSLQTTRPRAISPATSHRRGSPRVRDRAPPPPSLAMTPQVSSVEFRVRYAETDQMGVVYHSHYLVWCEIGRTDHIRGLGISYREMEEQGVNLAVAEASIRYKAPARYDDLVRVETTLGGLSSRTIVYDYVISNAISGACLATA